MHFYNILTVGQFSQKLSQFTGLSAHSRYGCSTHPILGPHYIRLHTALDTRMSMYIGPHMCMSGYVSAYHGVGKLLHTVLCHAVLVGVVNSLYAKMEQLHTMHTKMEQLHTMYTKMEQLHTMYTKMEQLHTMYTKMEQLHTMHTKMGQLYTMYTKMGQLHTMYTKMGQLHTTYTKMEQLHTTYTKMEQLHTTYTKMEQLYTRNVCTHSHKCTHIYTSKRCIHHVCWSASLLVQVWLRIHGS